MLYYGRELHAKSFVPSLMNSNEYSNLNIGRRSQCKRSIALSIAMAVSIIAHLSLLILVSGQQSNGPPPVRRISIELAPQMLDAPGTITPAERSGIQPYSDPLTGHDRSDDLAVTRKVAPARQDAMVMVANAASVDDGAIEPVESPVLPTRGLSKPAAVSKQLASSQPGSEDPGHRNWENSVRLDLMDWLQRHQRYPVAARRNGVQGAVLVRFVISSDGLLLEKELLQSSGSKHLDSAALKLLSRAAPYPKLPEELLADVLEVRLPIEYRLVDGRHRT